MTQTIRHDWTGTSLASAPVGIIGAGPGGLSAAVALKSRGIPFEVVDAGDRIGGIWDIERAETPMYEAAHFISSRTMSGFHGFPMPSDYPDYPRHDQILRYIQAYAAHHDLAGAITLRTRVERATPRAGAIGWDVRLSTNEVRCWSALIVATGTTWERNLPSVPGTFDGEQLHSFAFRSAEVFKGKRVLVVGGGNSGADIACEAARSADAAFISLRRGYHFVPKYIFGKPTDVFAHSGPRLPWRLEEKLFGFLLDRVLVGDLVRYGLPRPDHPLLRSHPIMNTQILHYLGHGDLQSRPDVAQLDGNRVRFADGRSEAIDLIVWATGYRRHFPFLEESGEADKLDLYLELFHRRQDTLFFVGIFETDGAAYDLFGHQSDAVAAYLAARARAPNVASAFDAKRRTARPDLSGGRPYIRSLRHDYYVRGDVYARALKRARRALDE